MRAITTDLRYMQNRHDVFKLLRQFALVRAARSGVS